MYAIRSYYAGPTLFMVSNILAGFAWSLGGTAMINYLLESLPAENSTGSLAWYTLGTNAAVLLGNSVGPIFAGLLTEEYITQPGCEPRARAVQSRFDPRNNFV